MAEANEYRLYMAERRLRDARSSEARRLAQMDIDDIHAHMVYVRGVRMWDER
jgi:hypothetical protein